MREYELEVLEKYPIDIKSTRKIRGAFFCETDKGQMVLKETKMSEQRALFLYRVLSCLKEAGEENIDVPVFTNENTLISMSGDGTRYLLKNWFSGKECDVRKTTEVMAAVKNLAVLHQKMSQITWEDKKDEHTPQYWIPKGRDLKDELVKHNRELKKISSFIIKKVNKESFEYLFVEKFEEVYRLAVQITQCLEKSNYEQLYKESLDRQVLIHGDYNYHNVLLLPDGHVTAVNFEHCRVDIKAQDLYYFFRKVMEKHKWDVALGDAMLNAYAGICTLSDDELNYIALRLAYPEKVWKIANAYYHSNKAWIPHKNYEKLNMAVTQSREKIQCIGKLFSLHL